MEILLNSSHWWSTKKNFTWPFQHKLRADWNQYSLLKTKSFNINSPDLTWKKPNNQITATHEKNVSAKKNSEDLEAQISPQRIQWVSFCLVFSHNALFPSVFNSSPSVSDNTLTRKLSISTGELLFKPTTHRPRHWLPTLKHPQPLSCVSQLQATFHLSLKSHPLLSQAWQRAGGEDGSTLGGRGLGGTEGGERVPLH